MPELQWFRKMSAPTRAPTAVDTVAAKHVGTQARLFDSYSLVRARVWRGSKVVVVASRGKRATSVRQRKAKEGGWAVGDPFPV